jgi:hypothetical protein
MDTISVCWDDAQLAEEILRNVERVGHAMTYLDRNGQRRFPVRGYKMCNHGRLG